MCCSTNASFYASHKPRFFILGLHTVRLKQPAYPIMHHARYEEHSFYFLFFFFFFSSFLLYYYSSYKQATRHVSPTEPRRHDIHVAKAREKERSYLLGPKERKRQDSPQSPRRFLRSESALFMRACVLAKHTRRHLLQPPSFFSFP